MSIESAPGEGTTVTIGLPVNGPKRRSDAPVGVLAMPATKPKGERDGERNGPLRKTA
jgi:cell cycle sensor histidine kinase DivJ